MGSHHLAVFSEYKNLQIFNADILLYINGIEMNFLYKLAHISSFKILKRFFHFISRMRSKNLFSTNAHISLKVQIFETKF